MATITPAGRAALDQVIAAHRVRVTVRQEAEAEARKLVADRIAAAARLESEAVRAAIAAGVPRSRIGREGLNTTDYATVARVLALTDTAASGEARAIEAARADLHASQVRRATPAETEVWASKLHPSGDVLLRIDWPGFEADALGVTAENAGTAVLDLVGWVHRFRPNDDDDWEPLDGGRALDDAMRYEAPLRAAIAAALR